MKEKFLKKRIKGKLLSATLILTMFLSLIPMGKMTVFAANNCEYYNVSDPGGNYVGHIKTSQLDSDDYYKFDKYTLTVDNTWLYNSGWVKYKPGYDAVCPDNPVIGTWYHLDLTDASNPKYVPCSNQSDAAHPGPTSIAECSIHGDCDHVKINDRSENEGWITWGGTGYERSGTVLPISDLPFYLFPENGTPDDFPEQQWFYLDEVESLFKPCNGQHIGDSDDGNLGGSGKVDIPKENEKGNFGAGGLANTINEIRDAVLTNDDKKDIAEGKNINVWVKIIERKIAEIKDADKQLINAKLPATYAVGTYLDISLLKQITGQDVPTSIEKTKGKVRIKLTVPKDLQKAGRTYKIIRIHNGVAEVLTTTQDANYNLTFETDGFSTYALIYSDATSAPAPVTSPKTGETNNMPLVMLILSLGVAFLGYTSRKELTK